MFDLFDKLFKSSSLMEEAFAESFNMLKDSYMMFKASVKSLRYSDTAELDFDIFAADKKINDYQREVRAKVLTHLAVARPADVGPGLVLVTVVIDVERIADYTKNIAEVAKAHPRRLSGDKYEDDLKRLEDEIEINFEKTVRAFENSDAALAHEVMDKHRDKSKWCDQVVNELITNPPHGLLTGHAVALALYVRYLKRIASHMTNIVSSIVNPFPDVGFKGGN